MTKQASVGVKTGESATTSLKVSTALPSFRSWTPLRWPLAAVTVAAALLTGCSSLAPRRFEGSAPTFDPVEFFTGRTVSWGVFENRAGEPARRFSTVCDGRREADGALLLDQTFTYEDGKIQQRHWRIRHLDAHRYEATANDVIGTATGEATAMRFTGNTRWRSSPAIRSSTCGCGNGCICRPEARRCSTGVQSTSWVSRWRRSQSSSGARRAARSGDPAQMDSFRWESVQPGFLG